MNFILKAAFFAAYVAALVLFLSEVKDYIMDNMDFDFISPTMCYLLTRLNAFEILSVYFAGISANFLKVHMLKYWTSS